MQKTATKAKSSSSYTRPALQKSTTLSRKYVRRPGVAKRVDGVKKVAKKTEVKKINVAAPATPKKEVEKKEQQTAFKTKAKAAELSEAISASAKKAPIKKHTVERSAEIQRFKEPSVKKVSIKVEEPAKASVKEAKAPAKATKLTVEEAEPAKSSKASKSAAKTAKPAAKTIKPVVKTVKPSAKARADKEADKARAAIQNVATMNSTKPMRKRGKGRVLLAFTCSAIVVAALGVFVAINMPNISVKVAAMQTGIDAEYPDFVPRNYSMETVASDKDGKITMKFVGPNESSFILTEEKSTWDSNAVLNNFVKENYSSNYSTMHEQGITYYSEAGSAAWVNGGILYKITSYGKNLSKEQIRNLVVSL